MLSLPTSRHVQWVPYNDADLQLSANLPTFHQLILYNITDFPDIVADHYFAQMKMQANILHKLGLTASGTKTHNKFNFASNIVSFGLLSFTFRGSVSFYSIWIFAVCLIVTSVIIYKVALFLFNFVCKYIHRN